MRQGICGKVFRTTKLAAVAITTTTLHCAVASAGTDVLFHRGSVAPNANDPVAVGAYWQNPDPKFPQTISLDSWLWIGTPNNVVPGKRKAVAFKISGRNLNRFDTANLQLGGMSPSTVLSNSDKYFQTEGAPATKLNIAYNLSAQVGGEWIGLKGTGGSTVEFTVLAASAYATCYSDKVNKEFKCIFDKAVTTDPPGEARLTELYYFPLDRDIDTTIAPELLAPSGSGNWSYELVTSDPFGNFQGHGGVKWVTDGSGILDGLEYASSFNCTATDNTYFDFYFYDANAGDYVWQTLYCPEPATNVMVLLGIAAIACIRLRKVRRGQ